MDGFPISLQFATRCALNFVAGVYNEDMEARWRNGNAHAWQVVYARVRFLSGPPRDTVGAPPPPYGKIPRGIASMIIGGGCLGVNPGPRPLRLLAPARSPRRPLSGCRLAWVDDSILRSDDVSGDLQGGIHVVDVDAPIAPSGDDDLHDGSVESVLVESTGFVQHLIQRR